MICQNCKNAGDNYELALSLPPSKTQQDAFAKAKAFHALCKNNDCFCQHRMIQ